MPAIFQTLPIDTGADRAILVGRLFIDPGDVVLVDRPTFAGALVAFEMQRPRFVGVDLEPDGTDVAGMRRQVEELAGQGVRPKFIYVVPDFQNPTGGIFLRRVEDPKAKSFAEDVALGADGEGTGGADR